MAEASMVPTMYLRWFKPDRYHWTMDLQQWWLCTDGRGEWKNIPVEAVDWGQPAPQEPPCKPQTQEI